MQNLNNYIISAPLSAILTLLTGVSLLIVFDVTGIAIFKRKEIWARALYFFTGFLVLSNVILTLSLIHFATVNVFRCLAGIIIIAAVILLRKQTILQDIYAPFRTTPNNTTERLLKYAVLTVLTAYFLISLAPPTDADSLDYHLGIPVTILNNSIWQNPDYLHFRLYGFGELLNTFGLSIGCAQFGAFIQYLSVLLLLAVFASATDKSKRYSFAALVLSAPLLLFLIATQKHQLTGIAATSVCFYVLAFKAEETDKSIYIALASTLLFAIGLKYSFIISVFVLMLLLSYKLQNKTAFYLSFVLLFVVFLLPLYSVKYQNFGDPISPILARLTTTDSTTINFYTALKKATDNKLLFPFNLFIPTSLGLVTTIIGIGSFLIAISLHFYKQYSLAVATILLACVLMLLQGQRTARFFLEPYYWCLFLFATISTIPKWISYTIQAVKLQFVVLVPLILFSAYRLAPGIVSDKQRKNVMAAYAVGYEQAKWIEETVPVDAMICTDIRSRALLSRKYFPLEYMNTDTATLREMLHRYKVNYLVLIDNPKQHKKILAFRGELIATKEFTKATRNPLNKKQYTFSIYKLKQ